MTNHVQPSAPSESSIDSLTYEQARAELVDVVQRLEQGTTSLEDSLALWERGEALATRCQTWLDNARDRLRAASEGTQDQTTAAQPSKEQD